VAAHKAATTSTSSLPTLEALEAALLGFPGPILAVSHDRWFIHRFARDVLVLRGGKLHS
jgi:ATPase subunit of ABC transporter with duplicated ATPase domains